MLLSVAYGFGCVCATRHARSVVGICLPAFLPTCLPTYLPAYLPAQVDPEYVHGLMGMYASFDEDRDGVLGAAEFAQVSAQ